MMLAESMAVVAVIVIASGGMGNVAPPVSPAMAATFKLN
jgi:hypothetical protein